MNEENPIGSDQIGDIARVYENRAGLFTIYTDKYRLEVRDFSVNSDISQRFLNIYNITVPDGDYWSVKIRVNTAGTLVVADVLLPKDGTYLQPIIIKTSLKLNVTDVEKVVREGIEEYNSRGSRFSSDADYQHSIGG